MVISIERGNTITADINANRRASHSLPSASRSD